MAHQVIHIHPAAPLKPAPGVPCNGCGVCCLAEPCPLGQLISRKCTGACNALRWSDAEALYRCGAISDAECVLGPRWRWAAPLLRRLARRWIAAGVGCDATLQTLPSEKKPDPAAATMPLTMLIWPLPALLTWALAWVVFVGLRAAGLGAVAAFVLALLVSGAPAWTGRTPWRRAFMLGGFPLSLLATGAAGALPGWIWLVPLALLLALYPLNTWRDAPLFPTPAPALKGLALKAPLPDGAHVVDAGCGLGAGLKALHGEYPQARILGLEWSWPLAALCALRCRFAKVRRADIWAADWSGYDLVYLFQRPESMPRAMDKAARELRSGSWLVSLEFEAVGWAHRARLQNVDGKPVWLYQAPFQRR